VTLFRTSNGECDSRMNKNTFTRVLYISVSPIQNSKPYRLLAFHEKLRGTVLYLRKPLADPSRDKESITKAAFDMDVLSGYDNHYLKTINLSDRGFFSAISFEVIKWVRRYDVIVIYGHNYFSFWLAMMAAKLYKKKLVMTNDATYMQASAESGGWKLKIKPAFLRFMYNKFVDGIFVPSSASYLFLESLGIRTEKIGVIPYAVDEDLIERISLSADVPEIRRKWKIPLEYTIFIFCAKFIGRKRPLDAIEAFAKIANEKIALMMIGDGPLMPLLKERAKELGLLDKIFFPGLVLYSLLPAYYSASDVLIFCSEHEPYGLPVNEAMICGKPVIVSDRIGARLDLVEQDKTGWIYRTGDVTQLSDLMQTAVSYKHTGRLEIMGRSAKERMTSWSSVTNLENQFAFFKDRSWVK